MNLGYLRRRYPLDRRRSNPKQVRFGIDDPLLRFWFRFVFPNMSAISQQRPRARVRRPHRAGSSKNAWHRVADFERLCREALPLVYAADRHRGMSRWATYW